MFFFHGCLTPLSILPLSYRLCLPPSPLLISVKFVRYDSSSMSDIAQNDDAKQALMNLVLNYHDQTKHSFTNYARGPHGLDWSNQPNPFRRFIPSPSIPLDHPPFSAENHVSVYSSLFNHFPLPNSVSKSSISRLFYESLALSAWKSTGYSTWSLRVNPSSGNLHPTEAYIIAPGIESVSDTSFVAHYAPKEHSLEIRARIPLDFLHKFFPKNSFLIGISSIFWREAWKYGERAFRYCNHDVGHAVGAVCFAAAGLGWDVKMLDGLGYSYVNKLLGLECYEEFTIPSRPARGKFPEIEFEHPDCVLLVFPSGIGEFDVNYHDLCLEISEFSKLDWNGKPNSLSREHVCWDVIYRTAEAVRKPMTMDDKVLVEEFQGCDLFSPGSYKGLSLREVVRRRRSAVDMDGVHVMDRDTFYQIMLHCSPYGSEKGKFYGRQTTLPFRVLSWDSRIHAALFVHRVAGLPKGLYFLVRNERHLDELRNAMSLDFKWEKPDGCPDGLYLYELIRGDFQQIAKRLSCHQDIAGDGCFSLGMVAYFQPTLHEYGVHMYPRLFWESGILGQVLYLEAHAIGLSATGIGCYFDNPVHEILGLEGMEFQSLYHFTVGAPVLDTRIMSLPAYPGPVIDT